MSSSANLRYVRSGGLANLRKVAVVDVASLRQSDPSAAERIEAAAVAVLAEPPSSTQPSRADGFQYALEITLGDRTTAVEVHEPVASAALRDLLSLLAPLSKIEP